MGHVCQRVEWSVLAVELGAAALGNAPNWVL
jgi:hypothetical protein